MIKKKRKFLLDASVLITAHRAYYAFDLCPGFWEAIKKGYEKNIIFSSQRVLGELLRNEDALSQWVRDELPESFFLNDNNASVTAEYAPMMQWVASKNFLDKARAKFASDADGWLVATAKHTGLWLVTLETKQIQAKGRVPIPNVCEEFGVKYCDTYEMLRHLSCKFH